MFCRAFERVACKNVCLVLCWKSIVKERRRSPRVFLNGHVSLSLGGMHLDLPAADISVSGIGVLIDAAVLGAKPSGEVGIRRLGERRLVGLRFESISDDELELIREYKRKCRETPAAS
jgi:hypothetical protein